MHNLTKLFLDYKYILKFIKNHINTRVFCYNNTIKWRPIVNMSIVNSGCSVTHVKKKIQKKEDTRMQQLEWKQTLFISMLIYPKATVKNSSTNQN